MARDDHACTFAPHIETLLDAETEEIGDAVDSRWLAVSFGRRYSSDDHCQASQCVHAPEKKEETVNHEKADRIGDEHDMPDSRNKQ